MLYRFAPCCVRVNILGLYETLNQLPLFSSGSHTSTMLHRYRTLWSWCIETKYETFSPHKCDCWTDYANRWRCMSIAGWPDLLHSHSSPWFSTHALYGAHSISPILLASHVKHGGAESLNMYRISEWPQDFSFWVQFENLFMEKAKVDRCERGCGWEV